MSTGDEYDDQDAVPASGESGEEADKPVEDGGEADEASAESFPSSDPPSSYAGPDVAPR